MIYYCILIVMTLMGAFASMFLKRASGSDDFLGLFKNRNLYFGGILYIFSAVLNIYVLRYLDYSIVLPLTSFTYIWTLILSGIKLKEKITKKKVFGVVLIITGAVLIKVNK